VVGRRKLAAAALAGLSTLAQAGGFSVAPVRLFFGDKDRAVAVRLTNQADEVLTLHTDVRAWTQDAQGGDRLEPSDDLIVSPPVLRIAPRAEQVVRLILAAPRDPTRQTAYRLILREQLPPLPADRPGAQIPIALALSLPVFITPGSARPALQCTLSASAGGPAAAVCENAGTGFVRLGRVELLEGGTTLARHDGGFYLLPGTRRVLPLQADAAAGARRATVLRAQLESGETRQWTVPAEPEGAR
jgi:fimbrial chaperone protein